MSKEETPSKFITVRVPTDLCERIDEEVVRMRTAAPGVDITFSDAVRNAIHRGLSGSDEK